MKGKIVFIKVFYSMFFLGVFFVFSCKNKDDLALYGYIKITVKDTLTGFPIKNATITSDPDGINNQNTDSSGVIFSNELDKEYYDITITKYGYISQTKKNVKTLVADQDTVHIQVYLKPVSPPILSTNQPVNILLNSADITSSVTDLGDIFLIQHGHCWSTSPNPTIFLATKTELGIMYSPGSFSSTLTNLIVNKTYYIKAYAINSVDTSYSEETNFFTTNSFTDNRDGKVYHAEKIGSQIWMIENLNYDASYSNCYENLPTNCSLYGKLYPYQTALNACPAGWHLPSISEWDTLFDFLGGSSVAYNQLIQGGSTGFNVLLSGYKLYDGQYYGLNQNAAFWTTTETSTSSAKGIYFFNNNSSIDKINSDKNNNFSIRCLKN